ncbi:hypothetical protein BdWA1_001686 [Babesia duncani]|uniref:Uncharacterized protein n=1 Tax=Babesia duncani TaxID=323732 RepID=A0AAD9UM56_9APIC|nr:hypothetical protein BdWA1_003972 [Babesia duncani]KAK2196440.1 hypothetical protein BdWA1_001686 [Babesia duncani]
MLETLVDTVAVTPEPGSIKDCISIDSYRDVPRQIAFDEELNDNCTESATRSMSSGDENQPEYLPLYKRLSSLFLAFQNCVSSNESISSNSSKEGALSLRQRLYESWGNIMKRNNVNARGSVAMFSSFQFDISKRFSPSDDNFADCFALFIEENNRLDSVDFKTEGLKCEIRHKSSHEIISESGPYRCVYEEELNSGAHSGFLRKIFANESIQGARIRFFQRIRNFTKNYTRGNINEKTDGNGKEDEKEGMRMFTCMPFRNGSNSKFASGGILKSYLHCFYKDKEEEPPVEEDENAKARLENHIRLHTDHWGEVQYDQIEIVLRDLEKGSIIKLPYNFKIL